MSPRAHGNHVRKVCGCRWKQWPKCAHPWYFSYKPRGGERVRFSFDAEFGGHVASKLDAEKKAAEIRKSIDDGTFERAHDRRAREQREAAERAERERAGLAPTTVVTLEQFAKVYIERAVEPSGKASWKDDKYLLATICAHNVADGRRLGDWPMIAITEDELESFLNAQRKAGRKASTLNHLVQVLKASFRWAARKGYVPRSPISTETTLKRTKHAKRTRRLDPDEETALLAAANPRLQRLIIAALETGLRLGEMRALTWRDVDLEERVLTVRAETAKDDDNRLIPISARLAAVLDMANTSPAGEKYSPTACVFGELGEPLGSIKKAWATAVLKAHGIKPVWVAGGALSSECRAHLRSIDLRFHDLRREAGSRWHEGGFQLHEVRDLLGHANVSQTDTYLSAKIAGLRASMKRFDAARGKPVASATTIEQRPLGHEESKETPKEQLH